MAKRLPRPSRIVQLAVHLSPEEAQALEDTAYLCRLSMTSFLRVLVVEGNANPRPVEWQAVAEQLAKGTAADPPKKLGRPLKNPPTPPKPRRKGTP